MENEKELGKKQKEPKPFITETDVTLEAALKNSLQQNQDANNIHIETNGDANKSPNTTVSRGYYETAFDKDVPLSKEETGKT